MSTLTDISIRLAELADVPRLLELYALLGVDGDPEITLAQSQDIFLEMTRDARHKVYVAQRDGRIVGSFSLVFVAGLPHGGRESCLVEDVVVERAEQRGGIGRRMMQFAMAQSAQRGCYKLSLSSHLKRDQAHRFYEGLGFDKHGYSFLIAPAAERTTAG